MRTTRIAIVLAFSLFFASHHAVAQSGATLVAIVTSQPNAALTRRVRAELQGLGVDVIVLKPPAEASSMRAPLEQAARSVGAVAAVRLIVSSEGKVEVWVADRVTGKAVVRELDATGTGSSDAAVAVGTVELLRASLMELHSPEPPHGDVAPTPALKELALPASLASPPPWSPRIGVSFGGGAELGVRGLGPSADATLGVWFRLGERVGARLIGHSSLSAAHVSTPEGSVDVRTLLVGAAISYDLAAPESTWVPTLSAGVAAAHVTTTGTAISPFVGTAADAWFAAPLVGAGVGYGVARGLRLRADGLVAWAFPAAHVLTPASDVGRWGAPAILLSVGVEVLWSP